MLSHAVYHGVDQRAESTPCMATAGGTLAQDSEQPRPKCTTVYCTYQSPHISVQPSDNCKQVLLWSFAQISVKGARMFALRTSLMRASAPACRMLAGPAAK